MLRLRSLAGLFALALPLAAPAASAQQLAARNVPVETPADHAPGGVHILTVLPDGSIGCDLASEAQAAAFRSQEQAQGTVRLTPLPSLNRGGTGFRILIRATDQLIERPAALLAFRRAAARWERIIQSNVTTVMDLDYGPNRFGTPYGTNVLGSTNSAQTFVGNGAGSAEVKAAIAARQTDNALLSLVNAIPVPTPSTIAGETGTTPLGQGIGGLVVLQALGFRSATASTTAAFGTVPNIGFNSAFPYDFNPRDGISAGQTDFEAVAVHEIGHALGFTSAIGGATTGNPYFTPWDLYRVRPEAVTPGESYTDGTGWETAPRVITPGPTSSAGVQVMFVGDAEYETSTARGDRTGGDGQQASHWRADDITGTYIGIMDPTLATGVREEITAADVRALELFGYLVDRTESTAAAQVTIAGNTVNIDFLTPIVREALPVGGGALGIQVANTGGPDALDYDATVAVDSVQTLTQGFVPSLSLTSASGQVAPGGSASLSLNVGGASGGAVVYGRIEMRLTDPNRGYATIPFQISIGTPALAAVAAPPTVSAPSGETAPATVDIRNTGDAPLTFVRVLEPAASDPATLQQPIEGDVVSTGAGPLADAPDTLPAPAGAAARSLAQLNIPGTAALRLYDLAQLPSGEILAVDGGDAATTTIYRAPADLSSVTATYTSASTFGGQVTGIAVNSKTGAVWIAVQETGLLREVRLDGTSVVATGPQIQTGVQPFSLAYSPELDAFFFGVLGSDALYAVDATGRVLPGYPAAVQARTGNPTSTPALAFTEGLVEMTTLASRLIQAGQFGRTVAGSSTFTLPVAIYGAERSQQDPNGTMFITSRTSANTASIRTLDPADLPAGVGTRIDAREPLFSQSLLAPGATRTLALTADARGLPQGAVQDGLAFLTNSPSNRVSRFAVTLNVGAVAGEDGPDAAVEAVTLWPNPATGAAQIRLAVSAPTAVTVAVYNTLGQRVAVLAEGEALAPGTHAMPFDASALAAGVYVVRVQAGTTVTTQKLTVVR